MLAAPAPRLSDGNELSGDGSVNYLLQFSGLSEAICERSQAWIVMCRDQSCLEHAIPQGTVTTSDRPLPAKSPAVVRERSVTARLALRLIRRPQPERWPPASSSMGGARRAC
jgi:hypothetical protein